MNGPQLQFGDDPRTVTLQRGWPSVMKLLAQQVNKATFEGYIRDIRPLKWEDHVVTLAVPSPFACAWLSGRYEDVIRQAMESVLANRVEIKFVVERTAESRTGRPWTVRNEEREMPPLRLSDRYESDRPASAPALSRVARHPSGPDWPAPLRLNDRFRFETFVVGASNRLAYGASTAVAEAPGLEYNPLVLTGPSGLGKTHLLHAIAHRALTNERELRIGFVDGESFIYRFLAGMPDLAPGTSRDFSDNIDLWLVDDAQFILGAERAREEFYHVLNELTRTGRQVVFSSDRGLRDTAIDERTRTRLEGGLVVEIAPPELETRMAIVEKLLASSGLAPKVIGAGMGELAYLIANGVRSNVRALEGAVTKLLAYCRVTGAPASVETAQEILADSLLDSSQRGWMRKGVGVEAIPSAVADQFDLAVEDLRGGRLDRRAVRARQIAMYLCRQLTESGFTEIGRALGGRDHATVKRGAARIREALESDAALRADVTRAKERIGR